MAADDIFWTSLLSRLLVVQAWGYLHSAQFENGVKAVERACELVQGLERPDIEAEARLVWARILSKQYKHEPALAQYEQVVALAKTAQNQILEADGWIVIGAQILWQTDVKPAQEPLQHALNLCQALQYKLGEMETLRLLGDLVKDQESVAYYKRALRLSHLLGDVVSSAEALGSLGVGLKLQGDLVGSQACHEEALATFRKLNMPESQEWLLGELGHTATMLGNYPAAEQYLTGALVIAGQLKDVFWQAWVKLPLGGCGMSAENRKKRCLP